MKTTLLLIATLAVSGGTIINVQDEDSSKQPVSVVQPITTQDEVAPPTPAETQVSPSDLAAPAVETPQVDETPSVVVDNQLPMEGPVVMGYPLESAAPAMVPAADCCNTCCQTTCCCPPPPPQKAKFCIVDMNCCSHEICVCVPPCCCGEQPQVSWRRGILGRQVGTLCWPSCGHRATVIVSCFGKVRVR